MLLFIVKYLPGSFKPNFIVFLQNVFKKKEGGDDVILSNT